MAVYYPMAARPSKRPGPSKWSWSGESDIACKNAESDLADMDGVPLFKANLKTAGHDGTLWQPHGGKFAETATRWLLWQLKGDQKAKAVFAGENCGLCSEPDWKVDRKNMK